MSPPRALWMLPSSFKSPLRTLAWHASLSVARPVGGGALYATALPLWTAESTNAALMTFFDCGSHNDLTSIEVLIRAEAGEADTHSSEASLSVGRAEQLEPQ